MSITKTAANMIRMGAGGTYSNARDAIRHQIWDTRMIGTSPSDNTYFSQPIGAPWASTGTKTKIETNLTDSGKLPNGQTILVTRISVALMSHYDMGSTGNATFPNAPILAQAYVNVMQSSVFEIRVAGREFDFQVHGRQFLPSLCVNGSMAATLGAARNGDTVVSGWIKLDPSPIFLDELVSFQVNQIVTNGDIANVNFSGKSLFNSCAWLAANFCTMQVCLEGFLTRAK
jgi:hypothetical protein